MKLYLIIMFSLVLISISCENEVIISGSGTLINFELVRSNSMDNYNTTAEKILSTDKRETWRYFGNDSAMLIQETNYKVLLQNHDTIEFGFWFIGYDKLEFLALGDYDSIYHRGESWDYIHSEDEINNFYYGAKEIRLLVENNVIFFPSSGNDILEIQQAEEVFINGQYKTFMEIEFNGTAYGWYDPQGIYQEVFQMKNGVLKGIIE